MGSMGMRSDATMHRTSMQSYMGSMGMGNTSGMGMAMGMGNTSGMGLGMGIGNTSGIGMGMGMGNTNMRMGVHQMGMQPMGSGMPDQQSMGMNMHGGAWSMAHPQGFQHWDDGHWARHSRRRERSRSPSPPRVPMYRCGC